MLEVMAIGSSYRSKRLIGNLEWATFILSNGSLLFVPFFSILPLKVM